MSLNFEKRINRIHRWAMVGTVLGSAIVLGLLGGGVYVVYLLLAHFGVTG